MIGVIKAFAGFDLQNPQHLVWLKRKLHNQVRYERQARRLPAHKRHARYKHVAPPALLKAPLGRDGWTMEWQRQLRTLLFHRPMPHPQYRRHPITGRII